MPARCRSGRGDASVRKRRLRPERRPVCRVARDPEFTCAQPDAHGSWARSLTNDLCRSSGSWLRGELEASSRRRIADAPSIPHRPSIPRVRGSRLRRGRSAGGRRGAGSGRVLMCRVERPRSPGPSRCGVHRQARRSRRPSDRWHHRLGRPRAVRLRSGRGVRCPGWRAVLALVFRHTCHRRRGILCRRRGYAAHSDWLRGSHDAHDCRVRGSRCRGERQRCEVAARWGRAARVGFCHLAVASIPRDRFGSRRRRALILMARHRHHVTGRHPIVRVGRVRADLLGWHAATAAG